MTGFFALALAKMSSGDAVTRLESPRRLNRLAEKSILEGCADTTVELNYLQRWVQVLLSAPSAPNEPSARMTRGPSIPAASSGQDLDRHRGPCAKQAGSGDSDLIEVEDGMDVAVLVNFNMS